MSKVDKKNFLKLRAKENDKKMKRNITAAVLIVAFLTGVAAVIAEIGDIRLHELLLPDYYAADVQSPFEPGNVNIVFVNSPRQNDNNEEYAQANEPNAQERDTHQGSAAYALGEYGEEDNEEYNEEYDKEPRPPPPYERFIAYSLPHTYPGAFSRIGFYSRIASALYPINFGMPEDYTSLGVTTFRGNNFRNSASWGTANVVEERLAIRYDFRVGNMERRFEITCAQAGCTEENCEQVHTRTTRWTGVGWTGQPAIVQWDWEVQQLMNLHPEMRGKEGLVEVIYGALDGFIYFFELETGRETRPRINLGEPIKGTVTVDPRGYPLLYVGQGDQMRTNRFGHYIFSLINGAELFFLNGRDPFSARVWGAFDSTPLFDTLNDRMVIVGENGVVYSIELNTAFDRAGREISIDPVISRYRHTGTRRLGTENSPVGFSHYIFFADNSGLITCLDMKTLEPVWLFDAGDDTDASIVADWEEENERLVLFTGTAVDLQGHGGRAFIRKLNAANGDLLWEYSVRAQYNTNVNGGVMATPVLGEHDIADLVIFWVAKVVGRGGGGLLLAFDRETGEVVWETVLPVFGWSSPVAVYTEDGRSFLAVSDAHGDMRLIRGRTGEVLHRISLGSNIEASAAAFGNFLVVGTRGERIFGIEIT